MNTIKITLEDLFNLPGAVIYNPDSYKSVTSVSTDTRTIRKNSLFVALKGPRFDGHNFVLEAIDKGASAVLINKKRLKDFDKVDRTLITVSNTISAYGGLARVWRERLKAKVIAITGSNGKTTTKEMISALLQKHYSVCKTMSNNNNHIGVPLTIFSADNSHDFLILELGTNHFGEIAYTSSIANPDYGIITNIGDSHLEFLVNRKGVAKEKLALLDTTAERGGKVFINNDDPLLKKKIKDYESCVTFGFSDSSDYKAEQLKNTKNGNPVVRITKGKTIIEAALPVYGNANVKNFIIAVSVCHEAGLSKNKILDAISEIKPVDKRLNVKTSDSFTLINDTYNANPESMKSAIEFLGSFGEAKRKIAILGDMFELGDQAAAAHKSLRKIITQNKINEVYTIGKFMKMLSDELQKTGVISKHFNSRDRLMKFMGENNFYNSAVLVKGSRGMKMEEFVKTLEDK